MTDLNTVFDQMMAQFKPEKAQGVDAVIQFDLSGDGGGQYWVHIVNGTVTSGEGMAENPTITVRSSADTWVDVATGKTNVVSAFMMGRVKVQGDMGFAIRMQSMFGL